MRIPRSLARTLLLALSAFPFFHSATDASPGPVPTAVEAIPILQIGDAYPGRPSETVFDFGESSFGSAMADSAGIVPIIARRSTYGDDLLTYNRNTGIASSFVQSGATTIEGLAVDNFGFGAVMRNNSGVTLTGAIVRDIPTGLTSPSLLFVTPGGAARTVIARNRAVPSQPNGAYMDNFLFGSSLGLIAFNLNDNGRVTFESSFRINGGDPHMGVYDWTTQSDLRRIIDDTQAVPGHAGAQWVTYVTSSIPDSPFEILFTQLGNNDQTIFRGRFMIGSAKYNALYRGSSSAGVNAIVDPVRGDQVPDRPAGTTFFNVLDGYLANRAGDVAFGGISTGSFDRGVYLSRPGQPVLKIRDNEDPIPTVPADTRQTLVDLKAMNDNDVTVVQSLFGTGGDARQALMICQPDGATKLIARSDQFPGQPTGAVVNLSGPDAINGNGDVLANVELPNSFEGGPNLALYAYLSAEDQLVRVLGPGDIINGMELIQARMLVPASGGGFGGTFENDRRFVAELRLRPLGDLTSGLSDTWGLYDMRVVVPEPASSAIVTTIAAALSVSRRRGRRGPRAA